MGRNEYSLTLVAFCVRHFCLLALYIRSSGATGLAQEPVFNFLLTCLLEQTQSQMT